MLPGIRSLIFAGIFSPGMRKMRPLGVIELVPPPGSRTLRLTTTLDLPLPPMMTVDCESAGSLLKKTAAVSKVVNTVPEPANVVFNDDFDSLSNDFSPKRQQASPLRVHLTLVDSTGQPLRRD